MSHSPEDSHLDQRGDDILRLTLEEAARRLGLDVSGDIPDDAKDRLEQVLSDELDRVTEQMDKGSTRRLN